MVRLKLLFKQCMIIEIQNNKSPVAMIKIIIEDIPLLKKSSGIFNLPFI